MSEKEKEELNKLQILCPFCGQVWTSRMEQSMYESQAGCDTCGFGQEFHYTIEIYCDNCGKLVYKKDGYHSN